MNTMLCILTAALFCSSTTLAYLYARRVAQDNKHLQTAACALHDLKSAANIVLGAAKLQDKLEPTAYTAMQQRQSAYIAMVCENLSQMLRGRRRPLCMQIRLGDMASEVRDACAALETLAGTHGVALTVDCRGNCAARFDRQALDRIVQNLIVNAVDACEHDGEICVTVDGQTQEDAVTLSVQDNGRGVAQEELPHIFKPYFSGKKTGACSGLGLFCVKSLAKCHDADLSVRSQSGQTCFSIRFAR